MWWRAPFGKEFSSGFSLQFSFLEAVTLQTMAVSGWREWDKSFFASPSSTAAWACSFWCRSSWWLLAWCFCDACSSPSERAASPSKFCTVQVNHEQLTLCSPRCKRLLRGDCWSCCSFWVERLFVSCTDLLEGWVPLSLEVVSQDRFSSLVSFGFQCCWKGFNLLSDAVGSLQWSCSFQTAFATVYLFIGQKQHSHFILKPKRTYELSWSCFILESISF